MSLSPQAELSAVAPIGEAMAASVYRGAGSLRYEQVETPRIGPGELLVRVEACGICHTDLKKIEHDLLPPPRIYGHENGRGRRRGGRRRRPVPGGRQGVSVPPHPVRRLFLLPPPRLRAVRNLQKGRRHGGIRARRRRLRPIRPGHGLDRRAGRREDPRITSASSAPPSSSPSTLASRRSRNAPCSRTRRCW